jgi:hypothetical protein
VDDGLLVSSEANDDMKELAQQFEFKEFGEPEIFLGVHLKRVDGKLRMDPSSYVHEQLERLKSTLPDDWLQVWRRHNTPMSEEYKPELDDTTLLSDGGNHLYRRYLGVLQWIGTIGRGDISFATSSLSRFGNSPRQGHMDAMRRVYGYLQAHPDKSVEINSEKLPALASLDTAMRTNMLKQYPDALEEEDPGDPEALGAPLSVAVAEDSNFAHDEITRRSITGIVAYVGRTPIMVKSTRQTAIQSSTYAAEFQSCRTGCEIAAGLRLTLRSMGVAVPGASVVFSDNLGVVQSSAIHSSAIKKKHVSISYHVVREFIASGVVEVVKIHTSDNVADIATKALGATTHHRMCRPLFDQPTWIAELQGRTSTQRS